MKLSELLGHPIIDRKTGKSLGCLVQVLTKDGRKAELLLALGPDMDCIVSVNDLWISDAGIFGDRCPWEKDAQWYPFPQRVPILDSTGQVLDSLLDCVLDEHAQCTECIGHKAAYSLKNGRIGTHAVIINAISESEITPESERSAAQEERQERLAQMGTPAAAGSELVGRIAQRDIMNPAGKIMLQKGAQVNAELLQQSIAQGWLVALATGTVRNG